MQFLWKYIEDLVGKGLEWTVIAELLFYASMTLVPMALPLSVLLATIMTFGSFGEKNELFAMKSGGISLYRIMYPLLLFNICVCIGAFYFSNNFLPYTQLKMRSLLYSINEQSPEINIRSGIFSEPVEDFSIKADKKNRGNNTLENIIIYDHRNSSGNNNITTAEYGTIKMTEDKRFLILDLYDGYRFEEIRNPKDLNSSNKTRPHQKTKFHRQTVYIEMDVLGMDRNNEDIYRGNFEMIDNSQIKEAVDSLRKVSDKREYETWMNLTNTSLYKGISKQGPEIIIQDSTEMHTNDIQLNIDSLYNSLNTSQKIKVNDFASNYARSAKSYIEVIDEELTSKSRWIARHEIEWHRKYTLSIACLLFYLIGAPLGAIIRKGGFGIPVIISVVIFLFYYMISIAFEKAVRELAFSPEFGMWISTYILIPIILYVLYSAGTDSLRISSHFYQTIKTFFKRKSKRTVESE